MPGTAMTGAPRVTMIAAFEGWNDAGEAASACITHLRACWGALPLAEIDPEDYYDFQVNRPRVAIDGGRREITWPTTRFFAAEAGGRRFILVAGVEPNMRWRGFVGEILALARRELVDDIVVLGALLADSPHSRPIPVTALASDPALAARLALMESTYEGPTGIVGVLLTEATDAGLPTVSLWAAVPHYVSHPPSPKATLALLARVEDIVDVSIPLREIAEEARAWQRGVDELAGQDEEVAEYVARLEDAVDTSDLPEASGEVIAREFERYLRRRDVGG